MPPLQFVNAGTVDALATAGVAVDQTGFVRETEWAVATPAPPLATVGAATCLAVVVHHRTTRRGGLAHVSTTNDLSQAKLYASALATIVFLLKRAIGNDPHDADHSPPLDVFLGGGDEFFAGKPVAGRTALLPEHPDLPKWLWSQLTFDYAVEIHDRRRTTSRLDVPRGQPLWDTGYVLYDAASDRVFVLDARNAALSMAVRQRDVQADEAGRDVTWGKHPGA